MSKTFASTYTVTANGTSITGRDSVTSGGGLSIDETITAPSTDQLVACVIDQSQLKAFFMVCDRALEVHTNTLGGTDDILLAAGIPVIWTINSGTTCPITADVTSLHVVLAAGANARFQAEFVYDPTV